MKTRKYKSKNAAIWEARGIAPSGHRAADRMAALLDLSTLFLGKEFAGYKFNKAIAMEVVKELDFQENELPKRSKTFQKKNTLRW